MLKTAGGSGCIGLFQKHIMPFKEFFFVSDADEYLDRLEGLIIRNYLIFYVKIF